MDDAERDRHIEATLRELDARGAKSAGPPEPEYCNVCQENVRGRDAMWYAEIDEEGNPIRDSDSDLLICAPCESWAYRAEANELWRHCR